MKRRFILNVYTFENETEVNTKLYTELEVKQEIAKHAMIFECYEIVGDNLVERRDLSNW